MLMIGPPRPLGDVARDAPPELVSICNKAMARHAAERYASAAEMARDLQNFLERRPVSARPGNLAYRARLAYERNRLLIWISAAAVLLLAVSFVFYLSNIWSERRKVQFHLDTFLAADMLDRYRDDVHPLLLAERAESDRWLASADTLLSRARKYQEAALAAEHASEPSDSAIYKTALDRFSLIEHKRSFVRKQFGESARIARMTLENASTAWDEAIHSIGANPVYKNLRGRLTAQWGLIPIGIDADAKCQVDGTTRSLDLWLFLFAPSGTMPGIVKDPATGAISKIVPTPESGMVMILLPGGYFHMGCDPNEPGRGRSEFERDLSLAPFFISKFETTVAQWKRLAEWDDSLTMSLPQDRLEDRLPAAGMSYVQALRVARYYGLTVPTEAQFEYACRAPNPLWSADPAASRPSWFGSKPENVLTPSGTPFENVKYNELPIPSVKDAPTGRAEPVGSFAPNPFGLYDIQGNVTEYCLDVFCEDPVELLKFPVEASNGLVWVDTRRFDKTRRSIRGANYTNPPGLSTRSSARQNTYATTFAAQRGIRFALELASP